MNITIGTDPEIFFKNHNGKVVSVHNLLPGTKDKPHPVSKGAIQVDGVAAEFNTDPAETEEEFVLNINTVLNNLIELMPGGYTPFISQTAHFTQGYMNRLPKYAKRLGCETDYDAYSGESNEAPDESVLFRTGAGHIHVGWGEGLSEDDPDHFEACQMITRQLDWFLALPSLLFDRDYKRRELYGKIGCFRPKPYGVEYRTLSNAWLKDERLIRWVFSNTKLAFDRLSGNGYEAIMVGEKEGASLAVLFDERYSVKHAVIAWCKHYDIPLPPKECWEI